MAENVVPTVRVGKFVGDAAEFLPCFLFDLSRGSRYRELIEVEEADEDGDDAGLEFGLEVGAFFKAGNQVGDLLQEGESDRGAFLNLSGRQGTILGSRVLIFAKPSGPKDSSMTGKFRTIVSLRCRRGYFCSLSSLEKFLRRSSIFAGSCSANVLLMAYFSVGKWSSTIYLAGYGSMQVRGYLYFQLHLINKEHQ
jgi:hypothetical protein